MTEGKKDNGALLRGQSSREYLYRQLSEMLREDIKSGKFAPGTRLPSMDDLAKEHCINKVTVRRALADLSAEGLIYSIPAQGTYVSETPPEDRPAKNKILTIGLVSHVLIPESTGMYHMDIISGIRDELSKMNGNLLILPAQEVQPHNKMHEAVMQSNLDGIIYLGPFESVRLRRMIEAGPPCALIDFQLRRHKEDAVLVDNRAGGYQAIEHLYGLGHRRIATILGIDDHVATKERLEGAYEAFDHIGLPRSALKIVPGDFLREGGNDAMARLLKEDVVPTGIFCMNDEMATGALQALHTKSSLTVPKDISIVGFDNISWATATNPPLTTVHIDKVLMGRLAVQRLLANLQDGPNHTATTTIIPTRLIERDSTAPPPDR